MNLAIKKFKTILIEQAIASFVMVLVPIFITFCMPRTTIELSRDGGQATAQITKHVLLVIPCQRITVDAITQVESETTSGKYGYASESDRRSDRKTHTAGKGSIIITGPHAKYKVESNPKDAPVHAAQIKAFVDDPSIAPFTITATLGWLMTYLIGGIATAIAALYVVLASLSVPLWLSRIRSSGGNNH